MSTMNAEELEYVARAIEGIDKRGLDEDHGTGIEKYYVPNARAYRYKCICCNVIEMDACVLRYHKDEAEHKKKAQYFSSKVNRVKLAATRFSRLLTKPMLDEMLMFDEVNDEESKDIVSSGFFHYLISARARGDEKLERTLWNLRSILFSERLVLVALAVWKAQCLLKVPKFESGEYFEAQEWFKSGWKSCKSQERESNAMEIIVSAVRPFLDPPKE